MMLRVGGVKPERVGDGRIDSEAEALNVLGGEERVRIRMVAVPIDEPDRVEHLHRLVRVEPRQHLRDRPQVPIDELDQPAIVVDRAAARPPGNEQFDVRNAERVLDVDRERTDAKRVFAAGARPRSAAQARASRARSSYWARQSWSSRPGSKCAGTGSWRIWRSRLVG